MASGRRRGGDTVPGGALLPCPPTHPEAARGRCKPRAAASTPPHAASHLAVRAKSLKQHKSSLRQHLQQVQGLAGSLAAAAGGGGGGGGGRTPARERTRSSRGGPECGASSQPPPHRQQQQAPAGREAHSLLRLLQLHIVMPQSVAIQHLAPLQAHLRVWWVWEGRGAARWAVADPASSSGASGGQHCPPSDRQLCALGGNGVRRESVPTHPPTCPPTHEPDAA